LLGKNGENATPVVISTVDATDFIKDGMLADAEIITASNDNEEGLTPGKRYIKFIFKTYQYGVEGEEVLQVEYLDVESLIDSYTSGNDWIVIDQDTNKISHKTQTGLPTDAQGITDAVTGTGAYGETKTFMVPQLTVDAAGHVTAVNEKQVSIKLPTAQTAADVAVTPNGNLTSANVQDALAELQGDINAINGVTWTGDDEINVDNTNHTIKHTGHTVTTTTSNNKNEDGDIVKVKSVVIPQLTVNEYGHVTAIDNKTFEIDFNVPTVSGTAEQIVVTPSNETGEDVNYTVSLATVNVNKTLDATDDYAKGTETAPQNTHTRVENITVDAYGRVTAYTLTTVEENWDCGIW
jgi:hypothetical protein